MELKYNKFYIGLAKDGSPNNFVVFKPRKNNIVVSIKLEHADDVQAKLDQSGLDFDETNRWYRLRLTVQDVDKNIDLLKELMKLAYENRNG